MSWYEPEMHHRINSSYSIRIMSTGRAPVGRYNLIHITQHKTDSPNDDEVTALWKSEETGEWTRHERSHCPTQSEVDEWLRNNVKVNGIQGLLKRIGMRDKHFVTYM